MLRDDGAARCAGSSHTLLSCGAVTPLIPDIDRAESLAHVRARIDRADCHETARSFARTLIELFPPWFTFAPEHFAVLTWGMGLHLVVSGPTSDRRARVALLTTSDSRNMTCAVLASSDARGEVADVSMHYTPSPEQRARARDVIALALHALFPEAPVDRALLRRVPEGRVFPEDVR